MAGRLARPRHVGLGLVSRAGAGVTGRFSRQFGRALAMVCGIAILRLKSAPQSVFIARVQIFQATMISFRLK